MEVVFGEVKAKMYNNSYFFHYESLSTGYDSIHCAF